MPGAPFAEELMVPRISVAINLPFLFFS
jgi:hypothetical protein